MILQISNPRLVDKVKSFRQLDLLRECPKPFAETEILYSCIGQHARKVRAHNTTGRTQVFRHRPEPLLLERKGRQGRDESIKYVRSIINNNCAEFGPLTSSGEAVQPPSIITSSDNLADCTRVIHAVRITLAGSSSVSVSLNSSSRFTSSCDFAATRGGAEIPEGCQTGCQQASGHE